MRRIYLLLPVLLLSGCAQLGLFRSNPPERIRLWDQAHRALEAEDFAQASDLFQRLAREHPDTNAGRESLFYLGTIMLDPRNPAWDPGPAEEHLQQYLTKDSVPEGAVHRRPEAQTLFQLARQLNLPADDRVPGLQPPTRVITKTQPPVIVRARDSQALAAEVDRLKKQVAERDGTIKQLREELERIRKTLTGKR